MRNEKNIIRFTNQLSSTITLKNTTKEVFFDDITKVKTNKISSKDFIKKYDNLFNGLTANFGKTYFSDKSLTQDKQNEKAINSFLASVRRNSNINYFTQLSNKDFIRFNQDLRTNTILKAKINKKVSKAKRKTYSRSTIFSKKDKKYKSTIGYIGFAENQVLSLKQVWQIDFIIKNNLIIQSRQEVLLRIKYDLYTENNKLFDANLWITFSSGFTKLRELKYLYKECLKSFADFVMRCQQSKLEVRLKRVCTYVIRKAGV